MTISTVFERWYETPMIVFGLKVENSLVSSSQTFSAAMR